MTPESRNSGRFFRGTSTKHFLTWSAAAANHKIQKLSKHLAQNVSKLQTKVEKALHPWDPPTGINQSPSSTTVLSPDNSVNKRHSNGLDDAQDHQHLLSANNVHVAVVHNLNVARGRKGTSSTSSIENENVNSVCDWKTSSRSRRKIDFELERSKTKNSGEGIDIFELTPLAHFKETEVLHDMNSSSSHDTSGSGISLGASTLPAMSPHW